MQVRVTDVKKWVGREETVQFREPWPLLVAERAEAPLKQPAAIEVTVRNTGRALLAEVHGEAEISLVCSRCLTPFWLKLSFSTVEEFREEPGPYEADAEYYRYLGDHIDLDPILADLVALAVPLAPVCSADCKGLCPHCGINRNQATCDCAAGVDPRWEALAGWNPAGPEPDSDA